MLDRLIVRIVRGCASHPWPVLLLALLLAGGSAFHVATRIAINTDTMKLLSEDLPWRQDELAMDAAFPQRVSTILAVIDGATPEVAEQAASRLAAALAQDTVHFRSVRRPDGGAFFERNGLLFLETAALQETLEGLIEAQPLLGPLSTDPSLRGVLDTLALALDGVARGEAELASLARPFDALAAAAEGAQAGRASPVSWRSLLTGEPPSRRELRRFLLVRPVLDYEQLTPGTTATAALRATALRLGLTEAAGVRVRLTGTVPLSDEEFASVADGAVLNGVLTLVAIVLLLWLAVRSGRLIAAILLTLLAGLSVTAAIGLALFGAFNLISVAFLVLAVGLGVDFGIQFAVRYRQERGGEGGLVAALAGAGGGVGRPLLIAALSTAAGFFALGPTDFRGASELGVIAGIGMLLLVAASFTLLPALVAVLRPPPERSDPRFASLAAADAALLRHRRLVLAFFALLAVLALFAVPQIRFDYNPLNLRSAATESVATLLDLGDDPDTTPNTVDVMAPSLAEAEALAPRLAALPEIRQVVTLSGFVPGDQEAKLAMIQDAALLLGPVLEAAERRPPPGDAENAAALATVADRLRSVTEGGSGPAVAAAQRLAAALSALAAGPPAARQLYADSLTEPLETLLSQLRASFQAAPVTLASLPEELVRDWVTPDGRARVEAYPAGDPNDNAVLAGLVRAVAPVAPHATGAPVWIIGWGTAIIQSFAEAGLWALLAIAVLLAAVLRRVSDVLRTLAPLLLSGLLTLGICGAFDLPLNFANIIALPLLFGIGVAFTIYYVMAWRRGEDRPLSSSMTRAVLFSALTTATAFGSLWLSAHPGTASMGRLLALSLACTLLATLLFLPALLGPPAPRRDEHAAGDPGAGGGLP